MLFFKAKLTDALRHVTCGKLIAEGDFMHPDRVIDTHLLLIGIKNTLNFQEDQDALDLHEGEALFLRPGLRQRSSAPSHAPVYYWTHFYLGEETEIVGHDDAIETYYFMKVGAARGDGRFILIPRHMGLLYPSRVCLLFQQLFYGRYGNCYSGRYADYCLGMLLIEMTQQAMEQYQPEFEAKPAFRFSEIVQWINLNISKPLTVLEIADAFGYTPNYLSDMFRRKTGYSLIRYVNRLRIERSKDMLLLGTMTIDEIARSVGFNDPKYFLRLFKRYMGVTPTKMKNAWTDAHLNNR
jgi:AraC-like DNA-binding protein